MTDDVRIRVRVDDDTGPGMRSAEQGVGGGLDKIKGALGKLGPAAAIAGGAMAAGLAVAAGAAALLKKSLDASIERASVGALIGAQGGGTDTKRIAELGKLAGAVYADNFGESLQQAGTAVRDVLRNHLIPEDAGDDAVKIIAEKLLTLGQIAETDSAAVARSVHKMLVTGMAKDADEAFDILTRGFQNGADEAGDLLDTFDEYSIQFKELGINGKEALGLIGQGLRGGARDADTVADALKEIAIRAKDGTKASADGFKMLGLDAKKLGPMFASGGDSARKALDMVIDKTKAIKDPMMQNAVATALFGTKSEDLQDALFGLDLDTAVQGLGDVAGAADKASAALGTGLGPALETFKRKFQQGFADVGDKLTPIVMEAIGTYQEFAGQLGDVFEGSKVPGEIMDSIKTLAHDYLPALKEALGTIVDKVRENKDEFEAVGHFIAEYVIPVIGFLLVNGVKGAALAFGGLVEQFGAIVDTGARVREFALNLAIVFLGAFDTIITTAAKAFGWVPGLGSKLEKAAAEVHDFVAKVNNELKNIRDEDVYVRTHFVGGQGQARGGEMRTGGIKGAAAGGVRRGLTEVGEEGRELVRLPQGASVYPHANAEQMSTMAGNMYGGGGGARLEIGSDGSRLGDLLVEILGVTMRRMGGDPSLLGLRKA